MSGMWLRVASRTETKRHVLRRDWTTCSKYVIHLSSIVDMIGSIYMTV